MAVQTTIIEFAFFDEEDFRKFMDTIGMNQYVWSWKELS
jgi:hypothetical protein